MREWGILGGCCSRLHCSFFPQTSRLLDEEERDDTGLRDNFKEKWTRTPSSELNKPFREELSKYEGIIGQAGQADVTVKEKYAGCRKAIEILSKSEEELAQLVPKGGASAARSGSQVGCLQSSHQLM